jgi:putative ABC transport system substrate-binding protein
MRRREFITLLGGAAAWPVRARAQQPKLRTIGFLGTGTPQTQGMWLASLVERLRELNWIDGRTVTIDVQWAAGRPERYAEIAADFVKRKVDVIVTSGSAVPALMKSTSVIPIVFGIEGDPVGRGIVASLARPGGNVTGLSALSADLTGKRIELLRELLPQLQRLAVMANADHSGAAQESKEVETIGGKVGIEIIPAPIRRPEDVAPAFEALKGKAQALYVCGDALVISQQRRINAFALGAHLPTIFSNRDYTESGGLMAYGPNFQDLHRRAGDYVDKILRGAKAAEMPVEQPVKFDLTINLTTAKVLGLKVPESFLLRADEVIE